MKLTAKFKNSLQYPNTNKTLVSYNDIQKDNSKWMTVSNFVNNFGIGQHLIEILGEDTLVCNAWIHNLAGLPENDGTAFKEYCLEKAILVKDSNYAFVYDKHEWVSHRGVSLSCNGKWVEKIYDYKGKAEVNEKIEAAIAEKKLQYARHQKGLSQTSANAMLIATDINDFLPVELQKKPAQYCDSRVKARSTVIDQIVALEQKSSKIAIKKYRMLGGYTPYTGPSAPVDDNGTPGWYGYGIRN